MGRWDRQRLLPITCTLASHTAPRATAPDVEALSGPRLCDQRTKPFPGAKEETAWGTL
jgi:hypothetical protein